MGPPVQTGPSPVFGGVPATPSSPSQAPPPSQQAQPSQAQPSQAQPSQAPPPSQAQPSQAPYESAPLQNFPAEREAPVAPIQAYLRLPITFTLLRSSEFDGRQVFHFDSQRSAYLPKLSGGFGFRPTLGLQFNRVLSNLSLSTGISFEYSKHQAISYNVGNSWYEHDSARFYHLGLELRGLIEFGPFKPFVGLTPSYGWLALPNGLTVVDANRQVSWSDLTLRGVAIEASAGLLYQFVPSFAVDAAFMFRESKLTASGSGGLGDYGFSPSVAGSVGAIAFY